MGCTLEPWHFTFRILNHLGPEIRITPDISVLGTYLIVSEGVTAMMASIIPAPRPANIDLGADSRPCTLVHSFDNG